MACWAAVLGAVAVAEDKALGVLSVVRELLGFAQTMMMMVHIALETLNKPRFIYLMRLHEVWRWGCQ